VGGAGEGWRTIAAPRALPLRFISVFTSGSLLVDPVEGDPGTARPLGEVGATMIGGGGGVFFVDSGWLTTTLAYAVITSSKGSLMDLIVWCTLVRIS